MSDTQQAERIYPPGLGGSPKSSAADLGWDVVLDALRRYAVLGLFVTLFLVLSVSTDSFLTTGNLFNIATQNAPLAIIAVAGTLVVIAGGFDLSTGSIYGVAGVTAAWVAVQVDPMVGLLTAPAVGLLLGLINGGIVTALKVHSFLATLATSLVFRGLATLITGGFLISVTDANFTVIGRDKVGPVYYAVIILVVFALLMGLVLNGTVFGRHVFAVGGNAEAAELSGVRVSRVKIITFALSGLAAGIAGAVAVSRIGSGQPTAGELLELEVIAAVILGGTSIYGGVGAIWRSVIGVYLLALIDNGFNILNANPFYKDLTTGSIIVLAVALSATGRRRR